MLSDLSWFVSPNNHSYKSHKPQLLDLLESYKPFQLSRETYLTWTFLLVSSPLVGQKKVSHVLGPTSPCFPPGFQAHFINLGYGARITFQLVYPLKIYIYHQNGKRISCTNFTYPAGVPKLDPEFYWVNHHSLIFIVTNSPLKRSSLLVKS